MGPLVRLPRRCGKRHSQRLWSLASKRFANIGFRACYPLAVDRHTLRTSMREPDIFSRASRLLEIVNQRCYSSVQQHAITYDLSRISELKDIVGLRSISAMLEKLEVDYSCNLGQARVFTFILLGDLSPRCCRNSRSTK